MTTTTTYTANVSGLSFRGLLLSEWIKLTSLRSTVWCYGIILLINLGLGLLLAASFSAATARASVAARSSRAGACCMTAMRGMVSLAGCGAT